MPRPSMFKGPLDEELPRVRVSKEMLTTVQIAADKYELSVSDLVRACLAHMLGLPHKNSELIARMIKSAVQGDD